MQPLHAISGNTNEETMTTINDRQSIGLKPARSTTNFTSRPKGITWHWEGGGNPEASIEDSKATLRSIQNSHLANKTQGYVDIAYNVAFDCLGNIFILRGFTIQGGANGTTAANRDYISAVYLSGPGEPLTDAAKEAIKTIRELANSHGIGQENWPHSHWKNTSCPGPEITEFIKTLGAGNSTPAPTPAPAPKPVGRPFPLPSGHYYGPYDKNNSRNHSGKYNPYDRPVIVEIQTKVGSPFRDGIIDTNGTTARLIGEWQTRNGLANDRLVGPLTWKKMFG